MNTITILGVRFNILSRKELFSECQKFLKGNTCAHIATVNPEFLVYGVQHSSFKHLLNTTTLNVCDGFGIVLLEQLLSGVKIPRIPGVEIADMLCQLCANENQSVYFLGGFGVAQKASEYIQKKYPSLIVAGYADDPNINDIRKTNPTVILVALGSPKQEQWISDFASKIPSLRIAIGIGGTFDFWSQKTKRAPYWMQQIGLEWLFRLFYQPQRFMRIFRAVFLFPFYRVFKSEL